MFLTKLFKNKKDRIDYPSLSDYSSFVTDVHSHLIPGIDDGSKSIEESVYLIRELAKLGFKKIITTPHIISDSYKNTPQIINQGLEELRTALAHSNISIAIDAAAEYYLDENFPTLLEKKNILAINNKYLLFEISFFNPPEQLMGLIFNMIIKGYTPLLAHVERYPFWFNRFEEYRRLKEAGVLFQLNTSSLNGYYGPAEKKTAQWLVDENMIDFIGSDLHGERHLEALKKNIREKYLWKLAAKGVKNSIL